MGKVIQLTEAVTFEREDCYACGVTFFVPAELQRQRKQNKAAFYCPNGHGQAYLKNEADGLRAKIKEWEAYSESLTKRKEWAEKEAQNQREFAASAKAAQEKAEAVAKRLKKRVANGVCPCCTRSFTNLRRHMLTKHPEHTQR